ncbi:hypothetical protein AX17_001428 [Amanita inopinata Kibby_2008]|nr:hypothetical protein AX17_001428 [Amanita inopinata Kibby_2008]
MASSSFIMHSDGERDVERIPTGHAGAVKKRRLYGACDSCRKKKGDSAVMPNNRCSNCIAFASECKHTPHLNKTQERETQRDHYIRTLEERLNKLEEASRLQSLAAQSPSSTQGDSPQAFPTLNPPSPNSLPRSYDSASPDAVPAKDFTEADDLAHVALAEHLRTLSVRTIDDRFFGQSSAFMLMKHASVAKKEFTGDKDSSLSRMFRRPVYWEIRPWERAYADTSRSIRYLYPDIDLIYQLINLYFQNVNIYFPLLHRPTFEKLLNENLHLRDPSFGAALLLVCAVGSQYSDDPRVLLEEDSSSHLSAGWKYFIQVPVLRNYFIDKVTIYDLQYYCLAVLYVFGTGVMHAAWSILGLGIRFAQELGLHRRRGGTEKATVDGELSKRAFWCLIAMDRLMSTFSGRPCATQDEDFDIDLPVQCDDEYWEIDDTSVTFNQPPGQPSRIAAFVAQLKLCEILAFTQKTLYSTKKSKILSGLVGDNWEQRIVTEIDSAMNNWKDSLPDNLIWDPHRQDLTAFDQSAALHTLFYQVQIHTHRPFLQKASPLSLPSLVICTNAARSCSHILEAQGKRGVMPFPHTLMAAFVSGIVLLLNLWGGRRSGIAAAPQKVAEDLHKCMHMLELSESRWHVAGRLRDMLRELATMRNDVCSNEQLLSNRGQRDSRPDELHNHPSGVTTNAAMPLSSGRPNNASAFHSNSQHPPNTLSDVWKDNDEMAYGRSSHMSPNTGYNLRSPSSNLDQTSATVMFNGQMLDNTDENTMPMWLNVPMDFK